MVSKALEKERGIGEWPKRLFVIDYLFGFEDVLLAENTH